MGIIHIVEDIRQDIKMEKALLLSSVFLFVLRIDRIRVFAYINSKTSFIYYLWRFYFQAKIVRFWSIFILCLSMIKA